MLKNSVAQKSLSENIVKLIESTKKSVALFIFDVCKNGTPNFKGSKATLKLKSHYGSKIHGNPFEQ